MSHREFVILFACQYVELKRECSLTFPSLDERMSLSRRSIRRIVLSSSRSCSSVRSHSQHNIYSQLEQSPFVSQP